MLLRLILLRLGPFAVLRLGKSRRNLKTGVLGIALFYAGMFLLASWKIIVWKEWKGIMLILISMLPQYLCYGFAVWMLIRCVWHVWSERVWKRIYSLSLVIVVLGILLENYWNPKILQFFCKFLN